MTKPPSRRRAPELMLHKAVAAYLNAVLPTIAWYTTIPAGGGGLIRGANLKACGYKAGTPDICIVYAGMAYWIELKAKDGRVSDEQKDTITRISFAGSPAEVCRSIDDVRAVLAMWRIPTLEAKRAA